MPDTSVPPSNSSGDLPFFTRCIATGLFSGYIPWAPGTWGSLVGLLIYCLPGAERSPILIILILIGFAAGVLTSRTVAAAVGHQLNVGAARAKSLFGPGGHGAPDPSIVVIDEIVGMWISLLLLPKTIPSVLIAFIAFRVFDILKPPPARHAERIPNGWGIMLDDVVAGVYSNLTVRLAIFCFPGILQGGL